MLAVRPDDLDAVRARFALWDVESSVIGYAIPQKRIRISAGGELVGDADIAFLVGGPEYERPTAPRPILAVEELPDEPEDFSGALRRLLQSPNICSREWVIRQYDHTVRASTILQPLQGRLESPSHGDAAVLQPVPDRSTGLALAVASRPFLSEVDPYQGGLQTIDEVCRNLVAVGARPQSMTNCLNFGSPEIPERLWELGEVVRGLGEASRAYGIAVPSGNVSLYNEAQDASILPTAVVLGAGIVDDIAQIVSSDLKGADNLLFHLGPMTEGLGGSIYLEQRGGTSPAPAVNLDISPELVSGVTEAARGGLLRSCHDVSDGGLAVTLAEMAFGGGMGFDVDIAGLRREARADVTLFSEAPSRWVVEVARDRAAEFLKLWGERPAVRLGITGGSALIVHDGFTNLFETPVDEAYEWWSRPLWDLLG